MAAEFHNMCVVKVRKGGEVRKFSISKAETYTNLERTIRNSFGGLDLGAFRLFWKDGDGDTIQLTNNGELQAALMELEKDYEKQALNITLVVSKNAPQVPYDTKYLD